MNAVERFLTWYHNPIDGEITELLCIGDLLDADDIRYANEKSAKIVINTIITNSVRESVSEIFKHQYAESL